jgi:hypothetical protein
MNSDTESLAFMEEDDVSPPPKNVPPASVPRPRIMVTPSPTPHKSTPAKPPLHQAFTPPSAPAGGHKSSGPVRPRLGQQVGRPKAGKQDTASEFSDNESVNFMVENNSISGRSMRGVPAARAPAPKQLSRVASNSSIQFQSEPGSRSTSPKPKLSSSAGGSTPAEKAMAPHSPPPNGKSQVTNDSISFFEQSDGSDQPGDASPIQHAATVRGRKAHAASNHAHPHTTTTAPTPVTAGSMLSSDSIAFQVDDDSGGDGHGQAPMNSSSTTPLVRATTITPSATLSTKSEIQMAKAMQLTSVADTSHNEFADSSSIAFDVVDDSLALKVAPHKTAATASPPKQPSAMRYYNSHVHRSHSAQSRPNSRPNSPSIQFESDHNSDNESALDHSAPQVADGNLSTGTASLPIFGQQKKTSPTLPMSEVPPSAPTNNHVDAANNSGRASVAPSTKKTVVTNHLQRRQQQQRQTRLPSPQTRPSTRTAAAEGEASLTPTTHPPLYQKAAMSTPIAAQAAAADHDSRTTPARSASLTDRNLPKKKNPSSVLRLQHPQPQTRRSKESVATESGGASPTAKLLTEAGSTETTNTPPEPLHTGRHSRTSTVGHISAQSLAARSQSNSVQGYLENQEVENAYHRDELSRHDRHTNRVLYREVSPPSQVAWADVSTTEEAEQWRRFNEQQRAELAQLRHRIAQARRQDRTLLGSSPMKGLGAASGPTSRRGIAPQPIPLALTSLPGWNKTGPGYSDMKQTSPANASLLQDSYWGTRTGSSARRVSPAAMNETGSHPHSARSQHQPPPPGSSQYAKQTGKLVSSAARPTHPSPPLQHTTAPRSGQARSKRADRSTAPLAADSPGITGDDVLRSAAAASVADMLGVLWPPRSAGAVSAKANQTLPFTSNALSTDLYFVNGSRLTPQQVDRFVDLVRVQAEAERRKNLSRSVFLDSADVTLSPQSYRHFSPSSGHPRSQSGTIQDDLVLSFSTPVKLQRAPLSAKLSSLLPKKVVRRSRVMREVFDVMDLKHQGTLVLNLLPSLAHLFEGELAALEQARTSLLRGRATPLATLLAAAVASRHQYVSTWGGGRGAADCTPSGCSVSSSRAKSCIDGSYGGMCQVLSADGAGLTPEAQDELISLTHRLLLLSFAVNVVIPIASASRIPLLDFPTLCMVLYAAVDNVEHEMDSPREQWRSVVQQYFVLLDS